MTKTTKRAAGGTTLPLAFIWLSVILLSSGCRVLHPHPIDMSRNGLPATLTSASESQIERGKPRPVIDAIGWVWGIPSKILLWDRRMENHDVSPATQQTIENYLADNGLDEVKVRLNQYRPIDDWRRLTRNTSVAWPWRYTFGAISVLGETVIPGRLFGGDHYNPYTGTIHLYSDVPAVALHEGAHAKDFARRTYPGTYAAAYLITPLWHERVATNDALAYADFSGDPKLQVETRQVLYPAYGTYVGSSLGNFVPSASFPLYIGSVLVGHGIAWQQTKNWNPHLTLPQNSTVSYRTQSEPDHVGQEGRNE